MNTDRLSFERNEVAPNITLWTHHMEVPFTHVRVLIPVGNAHSLPENGGAHGIAHLLEHMCLERSRAFPEKGAFEQQLARMGGDWNATTMPYNTDFFLQAPGDDVAILLPGFFSQIFETIFDPSDLSKQITIIQNERDLRKYYPGEDEVSAYKYNEWMNARHHSKEQLFGTNESLGSTTPQMLEHFHAHYHAHHINILVGGAFEQNEIVSLLPKHKSMEEQSLIQSVESEVWKRREYHSFHSKDLESPIYYWGNIVPHADMEAFWSMGFICEFLTNRNIGILYKWLRAKMGWSYSVASSQWFDVDQMGWEIEIPVTEESVVENIRAELHERVREALSSQVLLSEAIDMAKRSNCFSYQTLSERMDFASNYLSAFGRIPTERQYLEWLGSITPEYLSDAYSRYFDPSVTGELLVLSK